MNRGLSMHVAIALAVLAVCISLGGCSRPSQSAYAESRPSPPPHLTKTRLPKPYRLPVRKPPEPTKVTAVKSPPLPPQRPPATAEAKFNAAQEKAKLHGVHTLTQEDIEGLSSEQIKELRGY